MNFQLTKKILLSLFFGILFIANASAQSVYFSDESYIESIGSSFLNERSYVRVEPFTFEKKSRRRAVITFLHHNKEIKLRRKSSSDGVEVFTGKEKHRSNFPPYHKAKTDYVVTVSADKSEITVTRIYTNHKKESSTNSREFQIGKLVDCIEVTGTKACVDGYVVGPETKHILEYTPTNQAIQVKKIITDLNDDPKVMIIETHYPQSLSTNILNDAIAGSITAECVSGYCIGHTYADDLGHNRFTKGEVVGFADGGYLILRNLRWTTGSTTLSQLLDGIRAVKVE